MNTTYEKQSEPDYKKRSYNWKTAIGLQRVDGLEPTQYLIDLANKNIKGDISLKDVKDRLKSYYESRPIKNDAEKNKKEADLVSQRITEILSQNAFTLSEIELLAIHRRLFEGIYNFAGKIRDYNISKKEYILNGETVEYGNSEILRELLSHDIEKEKNFIYASLSEIEKVKHFARFISDIWQIHCFGEGNTRTIAVFAIKYLRSFGYDITNETFEKYSLYFRNALVRANYKNVKLNINETIEPLMKFFGNLLLGENNELKNRQLVIVCYKNNG
ncbi:MAG: Fic family protein [Endomicrobium sp.]|jgi:fido (protein-threonine AMPylation protein)|nr:Fic family protein [Endomicrobium sp.]